MSTCESCAHLIEQQRIVPDVTPGALRRALPPAAPDAGEPFDQILADWSHEDLELFAGLYDRFVAKFEHYALANDAGETAGAD